jgi:hypothetical protein
VCMYRYNFLSGEVRGEREGGREEFLKDGR